MSTTGRGVNPITVHSGIKHILTAGHKDMLGLAEAQRPAVRALVVSAHGGGLALGITSCWCQREAGFGQSHPGVLSGRGEITKRFSTSVEC